MVCIVKVWAWLEDVETFDYYYSNVCLLTEDGWSCVTFPDDLLAWVQWPFDFEFMTNLVRRHMKEDEKDIELELVWLNDPYSNEDWIVSMCFHRLFQSAGLV